MAWEVILLFEILKWADAGLRIGIYKNHYSVTIEGCTRECGIFGNNDDDDDG